MSERKGKFSRTRSRPIYLRFMRSAVNSALTWLLVVVVQCSAHRTDPLHIITANVTLGKRKVPNLAGSQH